MSQYRERTWGPRAGSPRGVVEATGYRCNLVRNPSFGAVPLLTARVNPVANAPGTDSMTCIATKTLPFCLHELRTRPQINKNIHRPATNHSFFARFIRGQRKVMKTRDAGAHGFARFGPDFCFDAAAADRAGGLTVCKEEIGRASCRERVE